MSGERNGVCEALTAALKQRKAWDEEPCLYTMYQEPDRVRLERALPDGAWPAGPPGQVLATFADQLSRVPPEHFAVRVLPNLLGMAFRCETWGVHGTKGFHALLTGPRPSQHPGRIEQRHMWAVARDGKRYVAFQNRGEKAITARRPDEMSGCIPEALERLVRAVTVGAN